MSYIFVNKLKCTLKGSNQGFKGNNDNLNSVWHNSLQQQLFFVVIQLHSFGKYLNCKSAKQFHLSMDSNRSF